MFRRSPCPLWLRRRARFATTRSQRRLHTAVAREKQELSELADRLLHDVAFALAVTRRVRQEILHRRVFGPVSVN